MTNAVIQFHPDGFDTGGARLMGRQAAGESFVRGFLRHAEVDRFRFWNWGALPTEQLDPLLRRIHPTDRPVDWLARHELSRIAETGCLFTPTPANTTEAWNRRIMGATSYSICGITHTTASAGAMDAVANMLLAPVEPWDALICTSRAVVTSLNQLLVGTAEYLRERLAPTAWPKLRLETIPLGVNAADFARDEGHRQAWRDRLGVADEDIVVLFVGRFSYHGKMNQLPMAIALERAARASGKRVHWVWSGWADNPSVEGVIKEFVARHAPSVTTHYLDGRSPEVRFPIWSAADVFFSLSDNIQETFGLTPVEAMAASLPSVVSDWDGYRDTVRHEIDGFRVPTRTARPGLGTDIALHFANTWINYDHYIGQASQFAAVDVDAAAEALQRLFEDPELRAKMGAAGKARATGELDWSAIIPRYQALWAELGEIRRAAPRQGPKPLNPWRPDPFSLFACYPTGPTTPDTLVHLAPGMTPDAAAALLDEPSIAYAEPATPNRGEIRALIARLAEVELLTVADLVADFPPHRRGVIERGVTWLAKYGCVALTPIPQVPRG